MMHAGVGGSPVSEVVLEKRELSVPAVQQEGRDWGVAGRKGEITFSVVLGEEAKREINPEPFLAFALVTASH